MDPGNSLVQLCSICWLSDARSLPYMSTKAKKTLQLATKCFQLNMRHVNSFHILLAE